MPPKKKTVSLSKIKEAEDRTRKVSELEINGKNATLRGDSPKRITDPDKLLDYFHIDREVWELAPRAKLGNWEMAAVVNDEVEVTPLFRIEVHLQMRTEYLRAKDEAKDIVKEIEQASKRRRFPNLQVIPKTGERVLAVPCLMDIHLAKLGWEPEVGGNYDLRIAKKRMRLAAEHGIRELKGKKVERTLFMVGNDFFHADTTQGNRGAFTTRGTPQDLDGRLRKVKKQGRELLTYCIDLFASLSPVDVVTVPGNHDKESILDTADALWCYYRQNERVTVEAEPMARKFYKYGENGFMMHHGHKVKPPLQPGVFANEGKEVWNNTSRHEIFMGHLHREQMMMSPVNEHGGCILRWFPSLSGHDAFHYENAFIFNKCAYQLLTYDAERGLNNLTPWSPQRGE